MKCPLCNGCLEPVILNYERYLFCFLCDRYYFWDGDTLKDVTSDIKPEMDLENSV